MNIKKFIFCVIFCAASVMMLAGCSDGKSDISDGKITGMYEQNYYENMM